MPTIETLHPIPEIVLKKKEISDHVCLVGPACSSGCMNTFAACWPGATPTSPDSDQQHQPPTAREASPSIKLCES